MRSAETEGVKKLRTFGQKLLGRSEFSLKSASGAEKLHFRVFRLGLEFLWVPKAKTAQNTTKPPFAGAGKRPRGASCLLLAACCWLLAR